MRPGQVRQDGVDGARERTPIDQHDKSTWPLGRQQHQFTDPAVEALWNPDYLRVAEFLSDGYEILEGSPGRDMAEIRPPTNGATIGAINVFPVSLSLCLSVSLSLSLSLFFTCVDGPGATDGVEHAGWSFGPLYPPRWVLDFPSASAHVYDDVPTPTHHSFEGTDGQFRIGFPYHF